MRLTFIIDYYAPAAHQLVAHFKVIKQGNATDYHTIELHTQDHHSWEGSLELPPQTTLALTYHYALYAQSVLVDEEMAEAHHLALETTTSHTERHVVRDQWATTTLPKVYTSAALQQVVYQHAERRMVSTPDSIVFSVTAIPAKGQQLALVGSSPALGAWDTAQALPLIRLSSYTWGLTLPLSPSLLAAEYKYVWLNEADKTLVAWEEGSNRSVLPFHKHVPQPHTLRLADGLVRLPLPLWRGAGMVLPLFSIRTAQTFGVGDMSSLVTLIRWCAAMGMSAIQLLPINDTTDQGGWRESYPYNGVSVFALHPMYLAIEAMGKLTGAMAEAYREQQQRLNALAAVDYEAVNREKWLFIRHQYDKHKAKVCQSKAYKAFCAANAAWLPQYAYFCYFRDLYHTADFRTWPQFATYDAEALQHYFAHDAQAADALQLHYYVQYELHRQLMEAKAVARTLGVMLKGDIPIGICRNSDSAWYCPELFNFDGQAGAPPDDFAQDGQNWGFPTYAWEQHTATNYAWWRQRLAHLSNYFDAYRIDHVLGFFRIWEIPYGTRSGLLGQFSPARGYTRDELTNWGFALDENLHLQPNVSCETLEQHIDSKDFLEVISCCFEQTSERTYSFVPCLTNQSALASLLTTQAHWHEATKQYLMHLFTEVLFVVDRTDPQRYHPRIQADKTALFQTLSQQQQAAFAQLYQHYYYQRNDSLWQREALQKLGALVASSNLLPCAEDLGMLPNGVRDTLNTLGLLSLEIQTMPKEPWVQFANTASYPYLSVATFATHDMPPLRNWWEATPATAAALYAEHLGGLGQAPSTATADICEAVVRQHLDSPSMLCLLAFQDWLAIDSELRPSDITHEQINRPDNPNPYWQYRMPYNVEALSENADFCARIRKLIAMAGR